MTTTQPDLPPYDNERILSAPFSERIRLACRTWANESPNQPSVMALYWAKYFVALIGGWAIWVSFNADYPGVTSPLEWAFTADAFKKAVVWSMFYELMGFGCGWGPMNARFKPMMGGCLHFARPGTTKLPLFVGAPLIGGHTRNWLDVAAYVATELLLFRVLIAPEVTTELLLPCFVAIPLLGVLDKTLFLVARSEHYWVALGCLTFAVGTTDTGGDLFASACKIVWGFIWFWAATSKLNHHFPHVIMFMMNNGPFFPKFLKKRLFKDFPEDLRPSTFATFMANFGSANEYLIPIVLLTSTNEIVTVLGLILMVGFHGFIALNNPNGMPVEWNILMIYGGIFLFGFNMDASPLALFTDAPILAAFVLFMMFCIPAFGNFVPARVSFLLSMRYYAGNWMYNVWLFKKGDAVEKLAKLEKNSGTVREQMAEFIPDEASLEIATNVNMLVSRFMHLQGRPLLEAIPRAVDHIDHYDWYEGEVLGGAILGWNFGDGHLNGIQLLRAVQAQCGFEPGELRIISVESQPLFGPKMHWQVWDAATGLVDEGHTDINAMRSLRPYPTGEYAAAIDGGQNLSNA